MKPLSLNSTLCVILNPKLVTLSKEIEKAEGELTSKPEVEAEPEIKDNTTNNQEVETDVKPEVEAAKPEVEADVKPEVEDVKPKVEADVKPEVEADVKRGRSRC